MEVFGRQRGNQAAPEVVTHPLLLDGNRTDRAAGISRAGRRARNSNPLSNALSSNQPGDLLAAIVDVIGGPAIQLFSSLLARRPVGETIRLDIPPGSFDRLRPARHPQPLERGDQDSERQVHERTRRASRQPCHFALPPESINRAEEQANAVEQERERQRQEEERAKLEAEEKARDEQAAAEKAEAEAAAARATEAEAAASEAPAEATTAGEDVEMEPSNEEAVASSHAPVEQAEASSSAVPERVTVLVHGNAVDITVTGIDPTFLEALPDDMREEVVNQHIRDQQAARVERPADSQISPEFLDALPPEIRAEIVQQKRIEQATARGWCRLRGYGDGPSNLHCESGSCVAPGGSHGVGRRLHSELPCAHDRRSWRLS